ncbi:MAG: hypothetical protein FD175_696 [Beijerinckiaceae bacterium]|nr:MAG: hypothetical protein FD175_696 [Beijerinckiaceae bacterium]
MISGLTFLAPFALIALVALPALYFLLKITPPPPRRIPLPTLPLVRDILGKEREPSRTPWWLLAIRLAAAAAIILAVAGPRWQPVSAISTQTATGPLILLFDDGWSSARDWQNRIARASSLLEQAANRPVILIATGVERPSVSPETATTVLSRLLSLTPRPHMVPRTPALELVQDLLQRTPDASIVWISDGVRVDDEKEVIERFINRAAGKLDIIASPASAALGLTGVVQVQDGLDVMVRRAAPGDATQGLLRAFDDKGRLLGDAIYALAATATQTRARLAMPIEILNDIARIDLADEKQAGAVHLLDAAHRRRRVALISGETTDTAQPLVSARYFVARALEPYSDLREPPRGAQDPIARALEERPDIMVLVDIGTVSGESAVALTRYVENGGMLVRFAGPGLAAASDDLLPVRLRRGGRILGGALSWEKPQKLGAFPETSPFQGLTVNTDIRVERQVLAEPDAELSRASWAVLEDGTPLVTGAMRGKGQIVLFHVTGDTSWSNLPLSVLFVDMLRRCLLVAKSQIGAGRGDVGDIREKLAPRLSLDGFGVLSAARTSAQPIEARFAGAASADHPPGFYGPAEASLAVNTLTPASNFSAIDFAGARVAALAEARTIDFRPLLMLLAALLVIADAIAMAILGGALAHLRTLRPGRAQAAALVGGVALAMAALGTPQPAKAQPAQAQNAAPPPVVDLRSIRKEDIRSSLRPRLAYVITGDSRVDDTSRAGLLGLGQILSQRTSLHLDEPIGLDPARDELVFYSLIYWPILPNQPRPSDRSIRAIDAFMKQGGTVIFDTRDAFIQRPGGQPTPETRALRVMLSALDIPALETIPSDHVLTKTFYILERFVGRYAAGDTWVEALAGQRAADTPARGGDRVSPIVITSNDLASAWAVDRLGSPLYPLVPGEPRQREMAFRTGVNLVMYVFTGNYKADQVHIPALLERLGQ